MRPAAALLALAAFPLLAQLPPSRFERAGEASAPGWHRVDLDAATRGHMMPDARDLRLLGPDGREVPFRLLAPRGGSAALPAQALGVVALPAGGWLLEFDLGASAPPHHAFRLEFSNRAAVSGCRLEGSPDRAAWRPLASGDLFRLGEGEGLSRSELAYAPSSDRYLRLLWPQGAEYPDVRRAEAAPAPLSPVTLLETALAVQTAGGLPGGAAYALTLPGTGLRLRHLRLEADGATLSYRLLVAREGCWTEVAGGALAADASGAWPAIPCPLGTGASTRLRLELASGTLPAPRLLKAWGAFEADVLVFNAPAAGRYRLAYGSVGVAPPSYPRFESPMALESLPALVLGAEAEGPAAGLPAARAALGSPLPDVPFAAAWAVVPAGKAGSVVRLELPEEVYARARVDLGDLRLEAGGKQLPFLLHSPPEPARVGEWEGLVPTPSREAGQSEVALPATPRGLPLTALELRAAASAFERPFTLTFAGEATRPGTDSPSWSAYGSWSCPGASALPCGVVVPLSLRGGGTAKITFRDGDNPPLPSVDATLWRRKHQVVYLQPEGPVRLVAGSPGLGAPTYDLEALRDQLLAVPWAEAKATAVAAPPAFGAGWVKPALVGALVLCGAFLLWILAKSMRRGASE